MDGFHRGLVYWAEPTVRGARSAPGEPKEQVAQRGRAAKPELDATQGLAERLRHRHSDARLLRLERHHLRPNRGREVHYFPSQR